MLSTVLATHCGRIICGRITQNFPAVGNILVNRNLGSDARPKKPLGSYLLFCKEKRPHILRDNPDLSFVEVGKQLGEEWKKLPVLEKQSFDIRAKELLEEYLREKREFESSLSEAELEELQQADLKKRLSKERRRIRAEMKKYDKPKRPKNAFAVFLKENFRKGEGSAPSEVSRIAELWKNTPEEERVPYQEKALRLKEEYDIELESWKERMIAEGRSDLLEIESNRTQKKKSRQSKRKTTKTEEVDKDEWDEEEDDEF